MLSQYIDVKFGKILAKNVEWSLARYGVALGGFGEPMIMVPTFSLCRDAACRIGCAVDNRKSLYPFL